MGTRSLGGAAGTSVMPPPQHEVSVAFSSEDGMHGLPGSWKLELMIETKLEGLITGGADTCDPTADPPAMAYDGIPYLAGRSMIVSIGREAEDMTHIDHVSLDWLPCGHPGGGTDSAPPGLEGWMQPHFDLHFFYSSPEDLANVGCPESPPSPICSTEVSPFKPILMTDMPDGYTPDLAAGVPKQGLHYVGPTGKWFTEGSEPVWIVGGLDDKLAFIEPMVSLSWLNTGGSYHENVQVPLSKRSIGQLADAWGIEVVSKDAESIKWKVHLSGPTCEKCDGTMMDRRGRNLLFGSMPSVTCCPEDGVVLG